MIIPSSIPLRPRASWDHYPTPSGSVLQALSLIETNRVETILDVGAGSGVWGTVAAMRWPRALTVGVEIRPVPPPPAYDYWITGDFRALPPQAFDLVLGNPPFRDLEGTIRHALQFLGPRSELLFLAPLRFLEGQRRAAGLWREYPPRTVGVLSKRPSFDGTGRTDASAYAVYHWRPAWKGRPEIVWL